MIVLATRRHLSSTRPAGRVRTVIRMTVDDGSETCVRHGWALFALVAGVEKVRRYVHFSLVHGEHFS